MPQILEHPTPVEQDFLPLNGTDYLEFYVGNARQAALLLSLRVRISVWRPIAGRRPARATAPRT